MPRKVYTAKDWKNAGIIGLIVASFMSWFLVWAGNSQSQVNTPTASPDASIQSVATPAKLDAPAVAIEPKDVAATAWAFHEATDSFSSKQFQYATVTSSNMFQFGFPYQGPQHATLLYEPQLHGSIFENFVHLTVERGQFICSGQYCTVLVKFDDGTLMNWSGHLPSDGSTNELRMQVYDDGAGGNAECFALKLARAKVITIRAEFYQEATRDLIFNVAGLNGLSLPKPSRSPKCRPHA
jgi:hypothetical protein